ncbi:MAG TPA: hypothetical protein VF556_17635 [Pyrinomonadaceae bacterium]|jgi:hypothetical protein
MGQSSEMMIEEHNERMATDEQYAADYEESMRMEAAHEEYYFQKELENEKFEDFFEDYRLAADGYEEIIEPAPVLIDDDIPF